MGNELAKMPFLIGHFRLHIATKPADNWMDFLRLHYANAQHGQTDPAHRQLPLHAVSFPVHAGMLLPAALEVSGLRVAEDDREEIQGQDETLLPADFRSRLLRPPRI